jgi:hypothetical protein
MTDPSRQLSIDDAVAEFCAMIEDMPEGGPGDAVASGRGPETPQEAETRRFLLAQYLIGLACPAPAACGDPRCRREATCRHLVHARDRFGAGRSSHPRRPPGADALRYAIWVYVASRRGGG